MRTWVSPAGAAERAGVLSGWSEPQRIVTEAAQWAGIPVWAPADTSTARESDDWALLRTEFVLPDKPVSCAFVQATAQSPEGARRYAYKLWCNGSVAGRGPGRSMGTEARYHTHDPTALLRPGPNALAALCYTAAGHQFQAQAVVVFADGSRQVTGTSPLWRAQRGAQTLTQTSAATAWCTRRRGPHRSTTPTWWTGRPSSATVTCSPTSTP